MLKPLHFATLVLILAAALPACSGKKTAAEQQAEKEKAWRAKQRTRAVEYYDELAEKFPDSQYASQAKERLAAMGATPGASKAKAKDSPKK